MKKIVLVNLIVMLLFVLPACNKNQKTVDNLFGIWFLVNINNQAISEEEMLTYVFDDCKSRKTEYCGLTTINYNSGKVGKYKVTDKGTTLFLDALFDGESIELKSEIMELTGSKLVIKLESGDQDILEFKKK